MALISPTAQSPTPRRLEESRLEADVELGRFLQGVIRVTDGALLRVASQTSDAGQCDD